MLYGNYGRQNAVLLDDDDNGDCGGGLIDEMRFYRQKRHAQSNLSDWQLKESSTKFLVLGGVQSPCPNGLTSREDFVGETVHTFDGIFDSEREREWFYVECMLRRLSEDDGEEEDLDLMYCINVCHMLSYCRASLDDYGRTKGLPHSAVRVDEDFHYMRGNAVPTTTSNVPIRWRGRVNPYF